jgi:DNA-binding FadR family transcriptional regulator
MMTYSLFGQDRCRYGGVVLSSLERQQTHDAVQDRVKAYILAQGLKPGDRLPSEHQLSKGLGVSRTVVREAMRGLEATGIIETRHGVGRRLKAFEFGSIADHLSYVLTVDIGSILDLLDVRRALELAFLPAAIDAITPEQLRELDTHVAGMRANAAAGRPFGAVDMDFHKELFRGVDNRVLQELLTTFWRLFLGVEQKGGLPQGNQEQTVEYHAAIAAAVRDRAVVRAKEVMDEHFRDVELRLGRVRR